MRKYFFSRDVNKKRTWNENAAFLSYYTMAHIVTWPSISMTWILAILDQCSFLLYLSSDTGHRQMTSRLRELGRLSSGNDSSLHKTKIEVISARKEDSFLEMTQAVDSYESGDFRERSRCWSPFPWKDFISSR